MMERDAQLHQFFAGYFNQDWDIGGATSWTDVVLQYIRENPRSTVLATRDALQSWLGDPESGPNLPNAFGCDYDPRPDGLDDRKWVCEIVEFIGRQLTH